MDVAWEKVALWILAILVILIIVFFIGHQLNPNGTGLINSFFKSITAASNSGPSVPNN